MTASPTFATCPRCGLLAGRGYSYHFDTTTEGRCICGPDNFLTEAECDLLASHCYCDGEEIEMAEPSNITEAVTDFAGFDPGQAREERMTDEAIRAYFCEENFLMMFGPEDGPISDWPWTYEALAAEAIRLRGIL